LKGSSLINDLTPENRDDKDYMFRLFKYIVAFIFLNILYLIHK